EVGAEDDAEQHAEADAERGAERGAEATPSQYSGISRQEEGVGEADMSPQHGDAGHRSFSVAEKLAHRESKGLRTVLQRQLRTAERLGLPRSIRESFQEQLGETQKRLTGAGG